MPLGKFLMSARLRSIEAMGACQKFIAGIRSETSYAPPPIAIRGRDLTGNIGSPTKSQPRPGISTKTRQALE
jgi:hypothetical protein